MVHPGAEVPNPGSRFPNHGFRTTEYVTAAARSRRIRGHTRQYAGNEKGSVRVSQSVRCALNHVPSPWRTG